MKFLFFISLVFLTLSSRAAQLQCDRLRIEIDENTYKTTFTESNGDMLVIYPSVQRQLLNPARRTYKDTYYYHTKETIINNGQSYIYIKQSNNSQTPNLEVRCQIIRN